MGLLDKFKDVWKPVTKIGTGIGRVVKGDWTGGIYATSSLTGTRPGWLRAFR